MRRCHGAALIASGAALAACVPHPAIESPAPAAVASFVVGSAAPATTSTLARSPDDSGRCELQAHFAGAARARPRELDVVLWRGWVAVTRNNDKRWDDLHLRVQTGGFDEERTIVLTPTVDSAGPPLTTWQAQDTIRLVLPYASGAPPRRLRFFLSYHTVGYAGRFATCEGILTSDTLHFVPLAGSR